MSQASKRRITLALTLAAIGLIGLLPVGAEARRGFPHFVQSEVSVGENLALIGEAIFGSPERGAAAAGSTAAPECGWWDWLVTGCSSNPVEFVPSAAVSETGAPAVSRAGDYYVTENVIERVVVREEADSSATRALLERLGVLEAQVARFDGRIDAINGYSPKSARRSRAADREDTSASIASAVSGGSSDASFGTLAVSGAATSTFANGLDIADGCFAVDGVCLSGAGGASLTGSTGQVAYFSGTDTAVGTSTISISSGGYVGVGTDNPDSPFHLVDHGTGGVASMHVVNESTAEWPSLQALYAPNTPNNAHGASLRFGVADALNQMAHVDYYNASTPKMTFGFFLNDDLMALDANGGLGIGTINPYAGTRLTLSGGGLALWSNGSSLGQLIDMSGNSHGYVDGVGLTIDGDGSSDVLRIRDSNANTISVIDESGNFGIGTTSPAATLAVYGDALLEGVSRHLNFGAVAGSSGYGFRDNGGTIEVKKSGGNWYEVASLDNVVQVDSGANVRSSSNQDLQSNVSGELNVALGGYALSGNTSGSNNIGLGRGAGDNITTGNNNIVIGGGNGFGTRVPDGEGSNQLNIGNLIYGTGMDGFWDTVSSGNIGIGTYAPTERLQVEGTLRVQGPADDKAIIALGDAGSGGGNYYMGIHRGTLGSVAAGGNYLNLGSWGGIALLTGNAALGSQTARLVIEDGTGYVGVGTTSPSAKLAITGTAGFGDIFRIASSTEASLLSVDYLGALSGGAGGLNLKAGGTNQSVTLTPSGTGDVVIDNGTIYSPKFVPSSGYVSVARADTDVSYVSMGHYGHTGIGLGYTGGLHWVNTVDSAAAMGGAADTQLTRPAAGKLSVDTVNDGDGLGTLIAGNIGIGTTSPYARLSVHGYANATNANTLFAVASSTAAATTTHFTVLNSGYVGVGTNAPTKTLVIGAAGDGSTINFSIGNAGMDTTIGATTFRNGSTGIFALDSQKQVDINFNAGGITGSSRTFKINYGSSATNALTIVGGSDQSNLGYVGIATTSPGSLLSVGNTNGINFSTATSTFSSTGGINLAAGCFAVGGVCVGGGGASLTGSTGQLAYFSGTDTAVGTSTVFISTAGNVGINTVSPAYKLEVNGSASTTALYMPRTAAAAVGTLNIGAVRIHTYEDNLLFGSNAGNFSSSGASGNIGIGTNVFQYLGGGDNNTSVGHGALGLLSSGSGNVAIGVSALGYNGSGSNNVAIGGSNTGLNVSGSNNILIGYETGQSLSSGSNNLAIGYSVGLPSNTASNQMTIGNLIFGTGLDGTGTTVSGGKVGIGTTSPYARLSVRGISGNMALVVSGDNDAELLTIDNVGNITMPGVAGGGGRRKSLRMLHQHLRPRVGVIALRRVFLAEA